MTNHNSLCLTFDLCLCYRQGDEANAAYIILNGRVRSVVRKVDGKKELMDEFGRGETIGVLSSFYLFT